jgi:hypothetical protein
MISIGLVLNCVSLHLKLKLAYAHLPEDDKKAEGRHCSVRYFRPLKAMRQIQDVIFMNLEKDWGRVTRV